MINRVKWRLGKIEILIVGKDGVARGALVRVEDKAKRSIVIERPVQKLYSLEIVSDRKEIVVAVPNGEGAPDQQQVVAVPNGDCAADQQQLEAVSRK